MRYTARQLAEELLKAPDARVDIMHEDESGDQVYLETSEFDICHADGEDGYIELVVQKNRNDICQFFGREVER